MQVQFLTWSAFKVETDTGHVVLFDPYLKGHPEGGVPPSPVPVEGFDRVDFIVVTHSTDDHMGDAVELAQRYDAKIVCGKDTYFIAQDLGCPLKRLTRVSAGGWFTYEGIWIKAIQAHHISMRKRPDGVQLTGYPMSFYLRESSGTTLFHGGDTSLHSDLGLFGELYPADVAILGIGKMVTAMLPSKGMHKGGVLPPAEAALACRMLRARNAIPVHYVPETGLGEEFCEMVRQHSPDTTSIVMTQGETREFSRTPALAAV